MKPKKIREQQLRQAQLALNCTPQSLGLNPELYSGAVRYLFDRPAPSNGNREWYWDTEEPEFEATPLEWTQIQTVLFANAQRDLQPFSNDQVGMGLYYLISNGISNVPFAAIDDQVPVENAIRMMQALPTLWRQCIGLRLESVHAPIGSSGGRLNFVCYMWFDIWPTFWNVRELRPWRDAIWNVFRKMLDVPCREVQISALHGIGHHIHDLDDRPAIEEAVAAFLRHLDPADAELRSYAAMALEGRVQ